MRQYRDALLTRVGDYAKKSPNVMCGPAALDQADVKVGRSQPKVHELIALAVAVTTRCDGCIVVHTKKAIENGATLEKITEALGVVIALNTGAALTYSAWVIEAHA